MKATSRGWLLLLLACLVLLPLTGCGGAVYSERMDKTQARFERNYKFSSLGEPVPLAGGQVTIRVPKGHTQQFLPGQGDPRRREPPFLPLPGFVYGYEYGPVDAEQKKMLHYTYVAVLESFTPPEGQPTLPQTLQEKLTAVPELAKSNPAWGDPIQCERDEGDTPVAWTKIAAAGDQFFDFTEAGQDAFRKIDGSFELWMHQDPWYTVLVGWRVPKNIAGQVPLAELTQRVAGTVKIKPPTEWKPDAAQMPFLGNDATLGEIVMQLPQGFAAAGAPTTVNAGGQPVQMITYGKDQDTLTLFYMVPKPGEFLSCEQIFNLFRGSIGTYVKEPAFQPFEHGLVNSLRCVRSKINGSTDAPPRQGSFYVCGDGAVFGGVLCVTPVAENVPLLETAAATLHRR